MLAVVKGTDRFNLNAYQYVMKGARFHTYIIREMNDTLRVVGAIKTETMDQVRLDKIVFTRKEATLIGLNFFESCAFCNDLYVLKEEGETNLKIKNWPSEITGAGLPQLLETFYSIKLLDLDKTGISNRAKIKSSVIPISVTESILYKFGIVKEPKTEATKVTSAVIDTIPVAPFPEDFYLP